MRSLLACSVVVAGALALAPVHRRVALAQGGSFLVAMPALAAGNAEAAKVKQSQAELKEILGAERNFQSGVLGRLRMCPGCSSSRRAVRKVKWMAIGDPINFGAFE